MPVAWPPFTCPRCRVPVTCHDAAWHCVQCGGTYPEVCGIADFRLEPDPWISLSDDRDKARRLLESTPGASFEHTVQAYWAMTPTTSAAQAARHTAAVLAAEARTQEWLAQPAVAPLLAPGDAPLLDLGCGTGELPALLAGRVPVIGIDIAFRWLVQARRRPALAGGAQLLVCCNAEHLPFPDGSMRGAVSLGMLEHCAAPEPVLREAHRVLQPGAPLHLRTVNRFTMLREPHVGVWGVGLVPRRHADAYVRARSGERYLHHRPVSARELRGALRVAGFREPRVTAGALLQSEVSRLPGAARPLAPAYARARSLPAIGGALSLVAPLLDATAMA